MTGVAAVSGRGRKPKPTAQRVANGNAGKRTINKNEPQFSDVTNIDAPEWMPALAQDMWRHLVPELLEQKVLKVTDLHNVESFCMAYCRWREAEEHVALNGIVMTGSQGGPIKNPALTAINETKKQMVQFGALLGLDPSSRTRLLGNKAPAAANPFARLVGGG